MFLFKRTLSALIFLILATFTAQADVVDRVVAIVNDDVITLSEVNEEGKALLQRVAANASPSELPEALKRVRQTVLEKLIEKRILQQEAAKVKITVTPEEVDIAYQRIMERNNLSPEVLQQQLASISLTEAQYKKNLETQVLSSKLVNLEIRSKVIIPENMIIDYYDTNYTERVGAGGYYILQIGIVWNPNSTDDSNTPRTKEEARQKAEQVRSLAVKGDDFRQLAMTHSALPSSVDGGDIGVINESDMSTGMQETITGTKPGGITPIIETSSGYQFFKVLSSQEGQIITKVSYESVKDEIYEILYQREMETRYTKWLEGMKSKAYIKIL